MNQCYEVTTIDGKDFSAIGLAEICEQKLIMKKAGELAKGIGAGVSLNEIVPLGKKMHDSIKYVRDKEKWMQYSRV